MKTRLKELRKEKGLLQEDIAKALEVSRPTISQWENGNGEIDFVNLKKLATFYNVSIDYILGFEPTIEPESVFSEAMNMMNRLDIKPEQFNNMTPQQMEYVKALIKTINEQNKKT